MPTYKKVYKDIISSYGVLLSDLQQVSNNPGEFACFVHLPHTMNIYVFKEQKIHF